MGISGEMRSPSRRRLLWQFLGSMRLAVNLLVLLAVASIIGTVLRQQESYSSYAFRFGEFWFQVYRDLGVYNVYRTLWYMGIVGFLVFSTATCITRNTPRMLKEILEFPVRQREGAIRAQEHFLELHSALPVPALQERLLSLLRGYGYRPRTEIRDGLCYVAARKGKFNRIGYFLTHLAIITICGAALYNADVPVRWAEWMGTLVPETNFDLPLPKIPHSAWMPLHNLAYRGSVTLPEGDTADVVFESAGDGYLVQKLPFRIHLKSFHIKYYSTGMPRDFVSDVVLYGPQGQVLKSGLVRVNHPMSYDGTEIYQSSFSDGGSLLRMRSFLLGLPAMAAGKLVGKVGQTLKAGSSGYSVSLKNFKMTNVVPWSSVDGHAHPGSPVINLGPSFIYVVHTPQGGAGEFKTYMLPIHRDGQSFYVQGFRATRGAPYTYVAIPNGPHGGISLFVDYLAALQQALNGGANPTPAVLTQVFQQVAEVAAPTMPPEKQALFVRDSMLAMTQMHDYPAPFILRLSSFHHRWAASLQVTKWPGTIVIYWGCVALVLGIFILFYLPQKKVWAELREDPEGGSRLLLGGSADRNKLEFSRTFEFWQKNLTDATEIH